MAEFTKPPIDAAGAGTADTTITPIDAAGAGTADTTITPIDAAGAEESGNNADNEQEPPKVCVQMVKDPDTYDRIGNDTTIAIKNGDGTYTVFKKGDANSPDFSPGNTYQQLVELLGGKRRKTAKRGGKSTRKGHKSSKKGGKSRKKGRRGKGSRRSKK